MVVTERNFLDPRRLQRRQLFEMVTAAVQADEFRDVEFDCLLFNRDRTLETNLIIQIQGVEVSNGSRLFDPVCDTNSEPSQSLFRADNNECVLRADYITSDNVLYTDRGQ